MNCSWIDVQFEGSAKNSSCRFSTYEFEYPCDNSYECSPYHITLNRGEYLIEVYGAQGGGPEDQSGRGGGIKGVLRNFKTRKYFAFVGAKGETCTGVPTKNSFGGGGIGFADKLYYTVGSGGGASDLRTSLSSLESRIIVAGGGGASGLNTWNIYYNRSPGGDGSGGDGSDALSEKGKPGKGASTNGIIKDGTTFSLGYGGNATCEEGNDGSGGGGGYYGGKAGQSFCTGGGGGSGFINLHMFHSIARFTGIREGNGLIRITHLSSTLSIHSVRSTCNRHSLIFVILSTLTSL